MAYPTRTGWATRQPRAALHPRWRGPCCICAGRAARRPRAVPHPALGELCAGEVRVLHPRRAGRPLATRLGWSGAQPWSLGRLRREGPRSPAWEEEGMAPVEEEQASRSTIAAGQQGHRVGKNVGGERKKIKKI